MVFHPFIVTIDGHDVVMVPEPEVFAFMLATKSLILAQREALRASDKKKIQVCKSRERLALDFVTRYEAWRAQQGALQSPPS